jgi:hypothetical protein
MLVKLQSDLITVAVYGMQDGCARLRKEQGAEIRQKPAKAGVEVALLEDAVEGETELERLRRENAKLLKLLGEKPAPQTVAGEGRHCVTCASF